MIESKTSSDETVKYIPIFNSEEIIIYMMNMLTSREHFSTEVKNAKAVANMKGGHKQITMEILEDVNPYDLLDKSKLPQIEKRLNEKLEVLGQEVKDTYVILQGNWLLNNTKTGPHSGKAYINLSDIHMKFRGLSGTNKKSTLHNKYYKKYLSIVNMLKDCSVKIDISNENRPAYKKARKKGITSIECYLINGVEWAWKDNNPTKGKVLGFWYDLGSIGEVYKQYIKQIVKLPQELLQLRNRQYSIAKNLGYYLMFIYRCGQASNNKAASYRNDLNFKKIMDLIGYNIENTSHKQQKINRFFKQLDKSINVLVNNNIISNKTKLPTDVTSKNYKEKNISIYWIR